MKRILSLVLLLGTLGLEARTLHFKNIMMAGSDPAMIVYEDRQSGIELNTVDLHEGYEATMELDDEVTTPCLAVYDMDGHFIIGTRAYFTLSGSDEYFLVYADYRMRQVDQYEYDAS